MKEETSFPENLYELKLPPNFWTLFVGHVILGLIAFFYPSFLVIHFWVYAFLAAYAVFFKGKSSVFLFLAYLVPAELLWRMTESAPFWETGKYAATLLSIAIILRSLPNQIRFHPIQVYFYFLLPGLFLGSLSFQSISFNFSGPISLVASVWALSTFRGKLALNSFYKNIYVLILPGVSILVYCLLFTLQQEEIKFVNDSLFITAGGFGPNQVSTIMGLGFLISIFLWHNSSSNRFKVVFATISFLFITQAAITFSRGGVWISLACGILYLILQKGNKRQIMLGFPLLLVLSGGFLNLVTDNMFSTRYSDFELSGRESLAKVELETFWKNPLFGVGLGNSQRVTGRGAAASHMEYTRLLAEHGVFGFGCMLLLLYLFFILLRGSIRHNFFFPSIVFAWGLLMMGHSSMRLFGPAFCLAVGVMLGQSFLKTREETSVAKYPIFRETKCKTV